MHCWGWNDWAENGNWKHDNVKWCILYLVKGNSCSIDHMQQYLKKCSACMRTWDVMEGNESRSEPEFMCAGPCIFPNPMHSDSEIWLKLVIQPGIISEQYLSHPLPIKSVRYESMSKIWRERNTYTMLGFQGNKVWLPGIEDKLPNFWVMDNVRIFDILGAAKEQEILEFLGINLPDRLCNMLGRDTTQLCQTHQVFNHQESDYVLSKHFEREFQ